MNPRRTWTQQDIRERLDYGTQRIAGRDACWSFWASRSSGGYGRLILGHTVLAAHRAAWEMAYGPIPAGMCVCHRCDHPWCVRPSHLFLGTVGDNFRDAGRKGHYRGERNGRAKLNERQVRDIRALRSKDLTQQVVASRFGVCRETVSMIWSGRTWRGG